MIVGIPLKMCGYKTSAVNNQARLITARLRYLGANLTPKLTSIVKKVKSVSTYIGYLPVKLLWHILKAGFSFKIALSSI